jgi:hypothetical protein
VPLNTPRSKPNTPVVALLPLITAFMSKRHQKSSPKRFRFTPDTLRTSLNQSKCSAKSTNAPITKVIASFSSQNVLMTNSPKKKRVHSPTFVSTLSPLSVKQLNKLQKCS